MDQIAEGDRKDLFETILDDPEEVRRVMEELRQTGLWHWRDDIEGAE
jgi:hypothetical protein